MNIIFIYQLVCTSRNSNHTTNALQLRIDKRNIYLVIMVLSTIVKSSRGLEPKQILQPIAFQANCERSPII